MVQTIFDYNCRTKNNEILPMEHFREKVLLVVNTASKCGFTPQFNGLEKLYKNLNSRGLEILGFPCNQFGKQDPGSIEKISQFCELNYGVTFTIFNKIEVNGTDADPLFEYLKTYRYFLGKLKFPNGEKSNNKANTRLRRRLEGAIVKTLKKNKEVKEFHFKKGNYTSRKEGEEEIKLNIFGHDKIIGLPNAIIC